MAGSKRLAAAAILVSLLALLVGPSAGLLASGPGCTVFVGWRVLPSSFKSVICVLLGGNNYTPPYPSPPPKELSDGYYSKDPNNKATYCPGAEAAVSEVVATAIYQQGRGIGASLIRLFFHDTFVQGADASVLLNTTKLTPGTATEREGPPNKDSLLGFDVIDKAKEATKRTCGGNVVSCADILAFAARDASAILSGGRINYTVPAGRLDGCRSLATDTNTLPGPDSTFDELVDMFDKQNLTAADMVTLSGAHSIGNARCVFSDDRRAANSNAMEPTYAARLRGECASGPQTRVDQDPFSPGADPSNTLDNQYYKNIVDKRVLFNSDAVLVTNAAARQQVQANIADATKWEHAFGEAMKKMGNHGVKTTLVRGVAEIREFCWKVNDDARRL